MAEPPKSGVRKVDFLTEVDFSLFQFLFRSEQITKRQDKSRQNSETELPSVSYFNFKIDGFSYDKSPLIIHDDLKLGSKILGFRIRLVKKCEYLKKKFYYIIT